MLVVSRYCATNASGTFISTKYVVLLRNGEHFGDAVCE
jgi:hypothetical protein